jgi:hypothetical protein
LPISGPRMGCFLMAATQAQWPSAKVREEFRRGLCMVAGSQWQSISESGRNALALELADVGNYRAKLDARLSERIRHAIAVGELDAATL